ncbi:AMP-binding protein [Amycolatopsis minnesotensis]|uniref:Acyl-CoA synthetase (AMP-forming)/AMP-acid ligase II n=1 Tax=Amycolatopsis minnesotensis TaxID=337894 RepID=A0ABN2R639_9PSEU
MGTALLAGETLGECLATLGKAAPGSVAAFPSEGDSITAGELDAAATRTARGFLGAGVAPGDVVGVLVPTAARFFTTIFGLWRAGAAVSVLPVQAGFGDAAGVARRLARLVGAAGMRHLVLGEVYAEIGRELTRLAPSLTIIDPEVRGAATAGLPPVAPDDLAVVQFTSGSTSTPKGVMLPHRATVAGLRAVVVSGGMTTDDVFVQWVPTYHDMGLIGLLSLWLNGSDVHAFAPVSFLRRPGEVLEYFARHRGSVLTGPNFSYDYLLDGVPAERIAGLDLSRWRLAFNGAEPIAAATVRRFTEALAPAGLRDSVMYPVYGMAEATLAISFPEPGSRPRTFTVDRAALAATGRAELVESGHANAKAVVSVGKPVHGVSVRVAGERGEPLPDGALGELQITGDPVTTGYFRDPAATAAAFDGEWLRTGDLGFSLGGELVVAGRRKEMVVVHGQNFFPDDVELIARDVPGVYRRHCVAFSDTAEDGSEHVGVIVEVDGRHADAAGLRAEVARRVAAELDLAKVRVHTVEPRWLSKTTSGKWQRVLASRRIDAEKGTL